MRYLLSFLFTLSTGAWLGAMVMAMTTLLVFFKIDRNLAVQVGPHLIVTFERVQFVAGAIAILSLIGWRLMVCTKPKKIILPILFIAVIGAVTSIAFITPRVNHLWFTGQGGTPEFWKWHGLSQVVYLFQLLSLLTVSALIPWAFRAERE